MASRLLADLQPHVREHCGEWLRRCGARGVPVLVYCTLRTKHEQDKLYKQGRNVQGKRISGQRIVTYAKGGFSAHNYGLAFDAVPWQTFVDGFALGKLRYTMNDDNIDHEVVLKRKLDWTPADSITLKKFRKVRELHLLDWEWRVMAEEALACDIEWGGLWKSFIDYCHFQVLSGNTIEDYRKKRVDGKIHT